MEYDFIGGGEGDQIEVPFVSDIVPTTNVWDRYKSLTKEDDGFDEFDPEYEGTEEWYEKMAETKPPTKRRSPKEGAETGPTRTE